MNTDVTGSNLTPHLPHINEIKSMLAPYQHSDNQKALRWLGITLGLYLGLWVAMIYSLQVSYLLTLMLAIPAAGLLVRIFIFFHDCGHNSFFVSKELNRRVGFWLGVLVFTPSEQWWHAHALHHASSGNLDKRGVGDVRTLTVTEYRSLPPFKRLEYRIFRNPGVMFLLGPIWMFGISHRIALPIFGRKESESVFWHNLALATLIVAVSLVISFPAYLMIQLPVLWLAGAWGIWLFYVQHQFENAYWARQAAWDYVSSALRGASYYRLPPLLQWFSGNIGYHHIHHLNPHIPCYNLEKCSKSYPTLQESATILDLVQSLRSLSFRLWDEQAGKMVGF